MAYGPELYEGLYRNAVLGMSGIATEITTGTAAAGAVTINDWMGLVTTEALTTAQNALYTLTITNDKVAVGDMVIVTIGNGTNTGGTPVLCTVTVAANSIVAIISNQHASAVAFNGTLRVRFMVIKALA